jgi:dATP pyrophosphohydrolase
MSAGRPDIVECWVYHEGAAGNLEYLLLHRAPGRIFVGLWQCVTGRVDRDERVPLAALREVEEETGLVQADLEALYDLEQIETFYDDDSDVLLRSMIFAVRARPDAAPRLSTEHDGYRWADREEAVRRSVWPAYRESINRIERDLTDPERARWLEVSFEGRRLAR